MSESRTTARLIERSSLLSSSGKPLSEYRVYEDGGEIVEKAAERSSDQIVALEFEGSPMLTVGIAWEHHIADWRGVFGTTSPEVPADFAWGKFDREFG